MKKILIALGIVFVLILGLVIYRIPVVHYVGVSYLKSKGLKVSFDLEKLDPSQITIANLRLEKNTFVSLIDLKISLSKPGLAKLEGLNIAIDKIDITEAQKLSEKFANSSNESEPMSFASLSESCQQAKPMAMKVALKTLSWGEIELPVEFQLGHTPNADDFSLSLKAEMSQSALKNYSADHLSLVSIVSLKCLPERIRLDIPQLEVQVKNLKSNNPPLSVSKGEFYLRNGGLEVTSDNSVSAELAPRLNLVATMEQKKYSLSTEGLRAKLLAPLDSPRKAQLELSGTKFLLTSPFDIRFKKFEFLLNGAVADGSNKGRFLISGFKYADGGEVYVQGLNAKGQFDLVEKEYRLNFDLSDSTKKLNFKNLAGSYWPESGDFKIEFGDSNTFEISTELKELFPIAGDLVLEGKAPLKIEGHFGYIDKALKGDLNLKVKTDLLKTDYGTFTNLSIEHSILEFPSLKSAKHRHFRASEIVAGPVFHDVDISYEIVDKSLINVEKLKFIYDGASYETGSFVLKPISQDLIGFSAKVSNLDLEKLLVIALKNTVTAEGTLHGSLKFSFKDKLPTLEGFLTVDNPGWIRFRPGEKPPPLIRLSDGAMEILNGYLYDFYYTSLHIDIASDDKYNMIMHLNTLGRNPGYLRGKPLKLNISLEQNLFAAIQALVLTYDLPNRLEKRLEKAGLK